MGGRTLPEAKIDEVRRQLDQGTPKRVIARTVGVSRWVVEEVARGERPDYEALRRERELAKERELFTGPLERCPGCGGMVQMPCRLCHIRGLKQVDRERAKGLSPRI